MVLLLALNWILLPGRLAYEMAVGVYPVGIEMGVPNIFGVLEEHVC